MRNRKLVSKVTISHDAEFYFGATTKPPAQKNKVQYGLCQFIEMSNYICEACLREAYVLTHILSCPYYTLIVVVGGLELVTKFQLCSVKHEQLCY